MSFRQLNNQAFSELFCPVLKRVHMNYIIFRNCTYIVFILQCQKAKTIQNCLRKAETSVVLMVFMVPSVTSVLMPLPFLTVLESGTRTNYILVSDHT